MGNWKVEFIVGDLVPCVQHAEVSGADRETVLHGSFLRERAMREVTDAPAPAKVELRRRCGGVVTAGRPPPTDGLPPAQKGRDVSGLFTLLMDTRVRVGVILS